MPDTERIRPDGCEGGACVEYRRVGDKVFLRNPARPDVLVEFTAAEWDTFVTGLVGDKICYEHGDYPQVVEAYEQTGAENAHLTELLTTVTAERDQLRENLITECAQTESLADENAHLRLRRKQAIASLAEVKTQIGAIWHALGIPADADADIVAEVRDLRARDKPGCSRAHQDLATVEAERDSLAAENARLRQEVGDNHRLRFEVEKVLDGVLGTEWTDGAGAGLAADVQMVAQQLERARHNAVTWHAEWVRAQAEVEVLRHRDRRTQAVVEAAVEWATDLRRFTASLYEVGEEQRRFQSPAKELLAAVDAFVKGPETGLSATEPVQQPQPVAQPIDGPEPQGEAQGLVGVFYLPYHGSVPASPVRIRRVWNAGDPEPEGVLSVRDKDGDRWVSPTGDGPWRIVGASDEAFWHELVETWGPLTEVLPEPTEPDAAAEQVRLRTEFRAMADNWTSKDGGTNSSDEYLRLSDEVARLIRSQAHALLRGDAASVGRLIMAQLAHVHGLAPTQPEGEVPEAGRAGEAQTEDQDRTEVGLDAAIEAAACAMWMAESGETHQDDWRAGVEEPWRNHWFRQAEAAIRAASPLIERAALNAAADALPEGRDGDDDMAILATEAIRGWLRDRATRTETP